MAATRSAAAPATSSTPASAAPIGDDAFADAAGPITTSDALARMAHETCRQHERRAGLQTIGVTQSELIAAQALVDTCDLALAECVRDFEATCATTPASADADTRQAANAMWLAAREYLRRHGIAEKASRQLQQHDAEKLGDLHFEYELEASALLALKQAAATYAKLRPQSR